MRKTARQDRAGEAPGPEPEFARPFAVDKLGQQPALVEIEAKPGEREALRVRFELESLDRLTAELRLRRAGDGPIRMDGRLRADGAQTCVVTLEPVPFVLDQEVAMAFAAPADLSETGEVVVEPEGDDAPEPIVDGAIDLGEQMAQCLAVALDPYPRAPGAALEASEFGPGDGVEETERTASGRPSPFAALARLKRDE
jgi:uncharacterized metal-binding protein YceD (DUF177 family)